MAAKTDKPVTVTTKKNKKTVNIVVDGKKYSFPSTPPLDLTLTMLEIEGDNPDQRQAAKILHLFRDRILPEELREALNDLDDILAIFTAWSETVGLGKPSPASPTKKPRQKSSASTAVK